MDETDRKHCLLDLHGVSDTANAEMFISKWRDGLEWLLGDLSNEDRADHAEKLADEASDEAKNLKAALSDIEDEIAVARRALSVAADIANKFS